jgi:hypothetical protein
MEEGGIKLKVVCAPPKRRIIEGDARLDTLLKDVFRFAQSVIESPIPHLGWVRPAYNWQTDTTPTTEEPPKGNEFLHFSETDLQCPFGQIADRWRRADPSRAPGDPIIIIASPNFKRDVPIAQVPPLIARNVQHRDVLQLFHEGKLLKAGMPLPDSFSWAEQTFYHLATDYASTDYDRKAFA